MKKQTQSDATQVRMLPPLENLTLEDWARICERVESRYGKRPDAVFDEEATR